MPIKIKNIASVAARVMITLIFFMSAVGNKIPKFSQVTQAMAAEGVPIPQVSLLGAILFLLVGSASIIVGYRTEIGAALLLVFLVLATFFFHDFWNFEGDQQQQQMIQFMKNLSLMGTMLFLIANGPGGCSIDQGKSMEQIDESE